MQGIIDITMQIEQKSNEERVAQIDEQINNINNRIELLKKQIKEAKEHRALLLQQKEEITGNHFLDDEKPLLE